MKEFKYTINGNKYEVVVGEAVGNNVEVTVNGETYTVEKESNQAKKQQVAVKAPAGAPKVAAPASAAAPSAGGDDVKAPLPGVIKEVCVAVGDKVEAGQTVIVLEAMKMANNIEAEKAGTITAVMVSVGDSVMEDTPLVTIG